MAGLAHTARPIQRLSGDFWKFWIGQAVSNLGSSFGGFALPLIVFKLTGSALNLANSSAASMLPLRNGRVCDADFGDWRHAPHRPLRGQVAACQR
jgi:hypothetical protein